MLFGKLEEEEEEWELARNHRMPFSLSPPNHGLRLFPYYNERKEKLLRDE